MIGLLFLLRRQDVLTGKLVTCICVYKHWKSQLAILRRRKYWWESFEANSRQSQTSANGVTDICGQTDKHQKLTQEGSNDLRAVGRGHSQDHPGSWWCRCQNWTLACSDHHCCSPEGQKRLGAELEVLWKAFLSSWNPAKRSPLMTTGTGSLSRSACLPCSTC